MERDSEPADFRRARRKQQRLQDPHTPEPPPHSIEAEQGVLGCLLLSPSECLPECTAKLQSSYAFYDLRHKVIYESMLDLHDGQRGIDVVTVLQMLRERSQLESVGGVAYLASLPDAVPSAANLPHYLDIVHTKFVLRRVLGLCVETKERIRESTSEVDVGELARSVESQFQRLMALMQSRPVLNGHPQKPSQVKKYDTERDRSCLLGVRESGAYSRYLCRGGSGWIIGPSGIGKSSLAVMMSMLWATGQPAFGIRPVGPLRVTVIQAENDEGDLAEMVKGVFSGLGWDDSSGMDLQSLLDANLSLRTESARIGRDFVRWLERVIREDKSDMVLLDPFLSFAGIDVSKQEQCSLFLRSWLNPVLHATGAALIGMHHTGKPKVDRRVKSMRPLTAMEQAYEGLGSSELVNWARLVMNLREVGDGFFELKLAKRGDRAGATNPDGSSTRSIWLRHGEGRIWWEQIAPPAPAEDDKEKAPRLTKAQRVAQLNTFTFLARCTEEGESLRAITKRLATWARSDAPQKVSISPSSARDAVDLLLNAEKLECRDDRYFRGPQA